MSNSQTSESFRDLLLRYRARTSLTQRELADRVGVNRRSVQEWENGATYPSAERLETLIQVLVESHGLTAGQEMAEALAFWAAVEREAPRMRAALDQAWLARLLGVRAVLAAPPTDALTSPPVEAIGHVAEERPAERRQDWGGAPDTTGFVGRADELLTLGSWVVDARCRLVAVLGMGGIGKTSLVAKLAQQVAPSFERVYWRRLRDAPPPSEWLAGAIGFLSDQQVVPPALESERLTALLQLLRGRRALLVLDNLETLFEPSQEEGRYRPGLAGYGRLLQAAGQVSHQSCLILTSREAPPELASLGSEAVRAIRLGGMGVDEAQVLLSSKQLEGTSQQWAELTARFGGNGLALKVVGETIRELFAGDICAFLAEAGASSLFGGMRRLLTTQVERCSVPEQQVLRVLAVEREPVTLAGLVASPGSRVPRGAVLEAVEALRRRSLVERAEAPGAVAFTLQSVVLEYVTERLVEAVTDEVERGEPVVLVEQPLIRARAKDYVRQRQERLLGESILERLRAQSGAEPLLLGLLEGWRGQPLSDQGYGPGNVVNLLRLLRGDLRGLDLSRLAIREAYLAEVEAQDANLAGAHLAETVLAEVFAFPGSIALSGDGALLAAGTSTGAVHVWRIADRTPMLVLQAHLSGVRAVALSGDGRLLASGGTDGMVRLWDTGSGGALATMRGHTAAVWSVALSADGSLLASGSTDGTARLWDATTGRALATAEGASGSASTVALSADGHLLASSGADGTIRLWEAPSGRALGTLGGHTSAVRSMALSADGHLLATSSEDGTVRLWQTSSAELQAILRGHAGGVLSVALSGDAHVLGSGGGDGVIRLWDTTMGQPSAILQGHTSVVWSVALTTDGDRLASGGSDGRLRLWETSTGRPLATLQGQTGAAQAVALSADGDLLASAGSDGRVHLWDTSHGRPLATLQGHTATVQGIALCADGTLLASGGAEETVRLWETRGGRPLALLEGHTGGVRAVALSADGHLLASGGAEGTVRLWDTTSGRLLAALHGHIGTVWSVALSSDGSLLASGGGEGTVRVWDTDGGRPLAVLEGHNGGVRGVALSADGHLLASGGAEGKIRLWAVPSGREVATLEGHTGGARGVALSADGRLLASVGGEATVRLWDTATGRPLATLEGHTAGVRGLALSADGTLLASGSLDETIRLWNTEKHMCTHTLRARRRYECLDITGVTGITEVQRAALIALGARATSGA